MARGRSLGEARPLEGANLHRVPLEGNYRVERGTVRRTRFGAAVHPSDLMRLRNRGRTPLFTRHCLGVIEAERDRRRHGR